MISPTTSSNTAAPMTTCPSGVRSCPRSDSTRAEMPIEVAVSAAPITRLGKNSMPNIRATASPPKNGKMTPTLPTVSAVVPTFASERRSVCRPIWNNRISTPSSASACRTGSVGSNSPSTLAPRITPATSSPSTEGCPMRCAISPKSLVATIVASRTISRCSNPPSVPRADPPCVPCAPVVKPWPWPVPVTSARTAAREASARRLALEVGVPLEPGHVLGDEHIRLFA
jgi:hypothetical protein